MLGFIFDTKRRITDDLESKILSDYSKISTPQTIVSEDYLGSGFSDKSLEKSSGNYQPNPTKKGRDLGFCPFFIETLTS
jgi:hypothetical protein